MPKTLVLCDCLGSQALDATRIESASGLKSSRVHTSLCMSQIGEAAEALAGGDVIVACQQERQRFADLAADLGVPEPGFVDLRDRAGWSDGQGDPIPKMAALAAEAALEMPATKSTDVVSAGVCLVVGAPSVAVPAATLLADTLAVTVLLTGDSEPPEDRQFDLVRGDLKRAKGTLGAFELRIDALQEVRRGGRAELGWCEPRNGGTSQCDIIVDLSGGKPLFPAHEKRDGYLRADPARPDTVTWAIANALKLVGTFEKPLYVSVQEPLCAHSRAEQVGCTRCLDVCPTGAITPAGEHVAVDPLICAGCGACSAVCPSGAISFDAPPVEALMRRITTLARTYFAAGGHAPRLLVHDGWGSEMISLAARHGDGLPADVIPLETDALPGFGHAEILAAQGAGFADVSILCGPKAERDSIAAQVELAAALSAKVRMLEPQEPDALSSMLRTNLPPDPTTEPILPMGTRRQITRLSAKALNPDTDRIDLPEGAPYGAVLVDTDACTLCLACVSLCPSGALLDNPDLPQLRFQEDACLQCGICATICPENAITLKPQLDLTDAALSQRVLNEEQPFACVECGAPFGVKSTVERVLEKLVGKHAMFQNESAARLIQMCDDCRVQTQFHAGDSPFHGGEKPRVRTTDDYLSKRKDH